VVQKGSQELGVFKILGPGESDQVSDMLSPLDLLLLGGFSRFALSLLASKELPRLQLSQSLGRTGDSFVVMVRYSHVDPLWFSNQ